MPGIRRTAAGLLSVFLAAGPLACLDDAARTARPTDESAAVVLRASAALAAEGEHSIGIRVFYLSGSAAVDLPASPSRVTLAAGETRREPVTVQLGRCLADDTREGAPAPGCRLYVELRLLNDAGATVDVQTSRAEQASLPGVVVELPSVSLSEVVSVAVAQTAGVRVQETRPLAATATGPNGTTLPGRTYSWTSSAPSIATVDAAGVVTGVAVGQATISATTGGKTGQTTVRVIPRVVSVDVTPTPLALAVGTTRQLTFVARDGAGAAISDLSERTVSWTSSDATVATVNSAGVVTALKPGSTTVTASVDGVTRAVPVTVTAVTRISITPPTTGLLLGATAKLTATALDASGATVPGITFTWSSSAPTVATVDQTGLVTATGAGTATITATGGGTSGAATITVTVQPISVSPINTTLQVARTQQLTVQNAVGPVTWSSSDASVASVDANGLVTALFPGTVSITVSSGGQTTQALVNTVPARVSYAAQTRENLILSGSDTLTGFTAYDANNAPIPGINVRWSSSAPTVATVTPLTADGRTAIFQAANTVGSTTFTARDARTNGVLASFPYTVFQSAYQPYYTGSGFTGMSAGQSLPVSINVFNSSGTPQANRLVRLGSSQPFLTVSPSSVRTNASGVATFTITANGPGTGYVYFMPDGDLYYNTVAVYICAVAC